MAGLSIQAHRQLYFDTGFDAGVSHFAPCSSGHPGGLGIDAPAEMTG